MSIGKRLLASTSDLASTIGDSKPTRDLTGSGSLMPRTAPGQMLAARDAMLGMQAELADLRQRLEHFDGSLPTVQLDPQKVRASRWANRHEASFSTPAFARLKESIAHAGGNTQPILVRQVQNDDYELAFGHRRHRACLELGLRVQSVVWNCPMSDMDLFLSMERENREREDLSAYEQGSSYLAALEAGLFPSQRRLAETLDVSHTWIRKTMMVARLPPKIIRAFASPLEVQPKHAEQINAALDRDPDLVVSRADRLSRGAVRLTAAQVVAHLTGRQSESPISIPVTVGGHEVGTCRHAAQGKVVISIDLANVDQGLWPAVGQAVAAALASMPVGDRFAAFR